VVVLCAVEASRVRPGLLHVRAETASDLHADEVYQPSLKKVS
jgi:hypothetical protein